MSGKVLSSIFLYWSLKLLSRRLFRSEQEMFVKNTLLPCSVCGEYYKRQPTTSSKLKGQNTFLKGRSNFKISASVDHERSASHPF